MTDQRETLIQEAIVQIACPYLPNGKLQKQHIEKILFQNSAITVSIKMGFPLGNYHEVLKNEIEATLKRLTNYPMVTVNLRSHIENHRVQHGLKGLLPIKNIIAVASGKGGVGKSTVTTHLAIAAQQLGAKVGILDADIYGPSQPTLLGITEKPETTAEKKLCPIEKYGLQTMSIGYLVDQNKPMIWRGPMVSSALQQMLNDTAWHDLDYLFIDLPPGTGDIQLTLAQKVPLSGAVVITTPQDLALMDVRRAVAMFEKVNVPILGVIENMSYHQCSQCGHIEHLFGTEGGQAIAHESQVPLLAQLPLNLALREAADQGLPLLYSQPQHEISKCYRETALKLTGFLSVQAKDYASKFPNIKVC